MMTLQSEKIMDRAADIIRRGCVSCGSSIDTRFALKPDDPDNLKFWCESCGYQWEATIEVPDLSKTA